VPGHVLTRPVASSTVETAGFDGEKLRIARQARRLSVLTLAEQVGISAGHLRLLQRGLRRPSIELIGRLENALAVTAADLGADLPDRAGHAAPGACPS
jgi:transcriptional regulator with XRE-family HTH domain